MNSVFFHGKFLWQTSSGKALPVEPNLMPNPSIERTRKGKARYARSSIFRFARLALASLSCQTLGRLSRFVKPHQIAGRNHEKQLLQSAVAAMSKSYLDPENLRELLIFTTSKTTSQMVEQHFARHRDDADLLSALVAIALEGEDAGDAPWAAANVLAEFPASLLAMHEASLYELSQHPWSYLHSPAQHALAKIRANGA